MIDTIVVVVHVVSGSIGLLLGPWALVADQRVLASGARGTSRPAAAYRIVVVVVAVSAVGLVLTRRHDLWWLVPVAALTVALTLLADVAARRRFRGWLAAYVHGQGGSYLALMTAFVVVALTVDGPVRGALSLIPWLAPTVVGTLAIEVWRHRLGRRLAMVRPTRSTVPEPEPSITR